MFLSRLSLLLIFICLYTLPMFSQADMTIWWVEHASGQAISSHGGGEHAASQIGCGNEVYLNYNDNTSGVYDIVYHILNEGDEDLVINTPQLVSDDAVYTLSVYGLTGEVTIPPNSELEFIVSYDSPEEYDPSNATISISSSYPAISACEFNIEVGEVPGGGCFSDPLNVEVVGTPAELGPAYDAWIASITNPVDDFLPIAGECYADLNKLYNCDVIIENLIGPSDLSLTIGGGTVTTTCCTKFKAFNTDCLISDPCSCDNPLNVTVGGATLYHDIITINAPAGLPITLATNDGALLTATGGMIAPGTAFTEMPAGNYELVIYTADSSPSTITIDVNGLQVPFTTTSCSCDPPVIGEPIPTMGEWGLMCLGLILLIFGIVAIKGRRSSLAIVE